MSIQLTPPFADNAHGRNRVLTHARIRRTVVDLEPSSGAVRAITVTVEYGNELGNGDFTRGDGPEATFNFVNSPDGGTELDDLIEEARATAQDKTSPSDTNGFSVIQALGRVLHGKLLATGKYTGQVS